MNFRHCNEPQVKICGITSVDDAKAASASGANAIGIVFYPKSSRYVGDLELARQIAMSVAVFTQVVGLFVDATKDEIDRVLSIVPLNMIQFHGNETNDFCRSFDRPYIKALRIKEDTDVLRQVSLFSGAKAVLLDAYQKGVPGGTGKSFDWQRVPHSCETPLILAGGLNPSNVGLAVETTGVSVIDVSGGVEKDGLAGQKDHQKVKHFIECARRAKFSPNIANDSSR